LGIVPLTGQGAKIADAMMGESSAESSSNPLNDPGVILGGMLEGSWKNLARTWEGGAAPTLREDVKCVN